MDSLEVKPLYQCSGIVSHQTSPFNVLKNVQFQISSFPSRQYECPFINDKNCHFQRNLVIYNDQRDHAYYRVHAGQIELQGRLGFQKFPEIERMATISKGIPSWKVDQHSPATDVENRCFNRVENIGGYCMLFPLFSMIRKVLLKVKAEEVDVILITPC